MIDDRWNDGGYLRVRGGKGGGLGGLSKGRKGTWWDEAV
jgi:hypothetical protein